MLRTSDVCLQDMVKGINRLYKEHNHANNTQME